MIERAVVLIWRRDDKQRVADNGSGMANSRVNVADQAISISGAWRNGAIK